MPDLFLPLPEFVVGLLRLLERSELDEDVDFDLFLAEEIGRELEWLAIFELALPLAFLAVGFFELDLLNSELLAFDFGVLTLEIP